MTDKPTPSRRIAKSISDVQAAANTATQQVDRIKRGLSKLSAAREEATIAHRMTAEVGSGIEKITDNLQEDLDQLRASLELLRKSGSQSAYVADRLGEMEEEFSDILNDEIDQVIRLADNDLSDQSESRLRDALEGAMTAPLKSALQGLTAHRRKVVLETIIETMIDEAIDESSTDDADGGE
jgi:uncharacterized phage infection (PIP) family protein YhgE